MVTPSQKGERSEAAILHALVASGHVVLMPWGASQRYDFVIDDGGGRFTRVQCKSGVYRDGCVYFRTASADRRRPNGDPYIGQVDAFAVYCAELDASFLIPIQDIQARQVAALRIEAPANGQTFGIRWASPYVLRRNPSAGLTSVPAGAMERKTRFELATPILARLCATTAPLPLEVET
jgi:PD-(D/E)XK nuclease superfamily protein